ncbi:hypothetical protein [Microbacterium maritypicum]
MIPRTPWRSRLRLALALIRGAVYVDHVRSNGWGQIIRLRTVDDVRMLEEGQR